jgi:hypothetical protein
MSKLLRALAASLVCGIASCAPAKMEGDPFALRFPATVDGGLDGLQRWIAALGPTVAAGVVDIMEVDPDRRFVLVVHNPYSGVYAVRPYLYACTPMKCELGFSSTWGVRLSEVSEQPLRLYLSEAKAAVEVRSSDGVVHVRVRIPPR